MPSDAYLRHFQFPRSQGGLEDATHRAVVQDAACGDELSLDLRVEGGCIQAARFRVRGCSGAIAAGSALVTLLPGRAAVPEALSPADLERELGGVPAGKRHVLRLALAALGAALQDSSSRT